MRQSPPENLVSLLESLRLATPSQVASVERRAQRLARGLPLFTSVWVDALLQSRRLTPLQASAINTQRGESLRVGPYVLFRKLTGLGFADVYKARHLETGTFRRIALFTPAEEEIDEIVTRLKRLVADSGELPHESDMLAPVEAYGWDASRLWVACDAPCERTVSEWMIGHGRFPAMAVSQIARSMMTGLVSLERAGLCHGDLRAQTVLLGNPRTASSSGLWLPFPGLRSAVRPHEGYAHADLPPEAFDGLAPERVRNGTVPDVHSDIYACGCLWWQLVTGRDPLPGGDALTKLQTAQRASIPDPKPLAPDAPRDLLKVIRACTQADPAKRPGSMAELASFLGSATRQSRPVARTIVNRRLRRTPREAIVDRRSRFLYAGAAVVLCAVIVAVSLMIANRHNNNDLAAVSSSPAVQQQDGQNDNGNQSKGRYEASIIPAIEIEPNTASKVDRTASHEQNEIPKVNPTSLSTNEPQHLLLRANDRPGDVPVARLPVKAGQRVHGPPGQRITLNVAREGLTVDVPGIVFQNIDFVWSDQADPWNTNAPPAILTINAPNITLEGCTFRSTNPPIDAIHWIHPAESDRATLSLPNGRAIIADCVFRDVATAVDCRVRGAMAVRFTNVLHLDSGPMVHLTHLPRPDEPVFLSFDQTTLRQSGPLLRCHVSAASPVGKISIETNRCVFSPREGRPLMRFSGKTRPDTLTSRIVWTGQGSLVEPGCPIASRTTSTGQDEIVPENSLSIDGLVRGKVDFAGEATSPPTASQAVRWLAPLQSDTAPGINAAALPE